MTLESREWRRLGHEILAWARTLTSAAVYATLIVTFGFQVARVEGRSMEPALHDQDRLIAAPGDTVAFRGGVVLRNGKAVDEAFLAPELRSVENLEPIVVPDGYSRAFGPVPKKYILGRVQVRWWPIPDAKAFNPK